MRPDILIALLILSGNLRANIPQFDSISANVNRLSFVHAEQAREEVKNLYLIAKLHPEVTGLLPQSIYWESYLNYSQGIADAGMSSRIQVNLKKYNSKSHPFENALLLHSLAMNDVMTGNYTDALTNSLQALIQYRQTGNEIFSSRALQLLGVICYRTRNFGMSEKFSRESLKALPKIEYYKSLINMYSAQVFIKGKSKTAQASLLRLIPILKATNDPGLLSVGYLNLGAIYYYSNDADNAFIYFTKALDISKHMENESFSVSLLVNTSAHFIDKKDYKTAKRYIDEAELIAIRSNNSEQLSMVYYTMSNLYENLQKTDSAYYYLKKYNSIKEAISNSSKTIDSYQAYVGNFLKSAEKEVSIARQNAKLDRRRYILTLIVSVSFFLLGVSLLIIFLQKKRQQALIKDSEKKSLERELQYEKAIKQAHEDKHKAILEAKVREVTSYSLMVSHKNDVLQEVLEQAMPLKKLLQGDDSHFVRNITGLINDSLKTDQESNKFIHHFNEVHPDFFSKLKSACHGLTENNLRMCAYFKMGMSTKQVASILNISLETVKNGRYRLKKKLGLGELENLDDFIRNI